MDGSKVVRVGVCAALVFPEKGFGSTAGLSEVPERTTAKSGSGSPTILCSWLFEARCRDLQPVKTSVSDNFTQVLYARCCTHTRVHVNPLILRRSPAHTPPAHLSQKFTSSSLPWSSSRSSSSAPEGNVASSVTNKETRLRRQESANLVHGVVDLLEFFVTISGLSERLHHRLLDLGKQLEHTHTHTRFHSEEL